MTKRGFTLIAALLVVAVLVSVGAGLASIATRKVKLSTSARESTRAFFAADAGLECMMYWDLTMNKFGEEHNQEIQCLGETFETSSKGKDTPITLELRSNEGKEGEMCASVTLIKNKFESTIESRGHNTCDTNNPRRVERALRITYE